MEVPGPGADPPATTSGGAASGGAASGGRKRTRTRRWLPLGFRGYERSWLRPDIMAGLTLAAVAIPETMGYTSIAQVPVVTGLYTVLFPTIVFALLGSSRLLVVGADSATAAILGGGLATLGIVGLTPGSPTWLALCSLVALLCGGLLALARLLRLGFLGDFLSASVLIGFLTGVGIQVATGQIPEMLGLAKQGDDWFTQQWNTIKHLPDLQPLALVFTLVTLGLIFGCKRFAPRVPGAIIAVLGSIIVCTILDLPATGLAVVGAMQGGFPPIGLPNLAALSAIGWPELGNLTPIAFSCFVLIVAQSAATSRSFATRHGQRVDVNRDLLGLSGANLAAGITGTFVVNGSPTKTQILDQQKGRTQVANLTMAAVVLVILLFLTDLLTNLPKPVLGAIVFTIGLELIDLGGLRRVWKARRSELIIAVTTAVVVFAIGVQQGIVLAIVMSLVDVVRRQYRPHKFVIGIDNDGDPTYAPAAAGMQSAPGLIVFRYDADLFYANANQFSDDVQAIITAAPDPVRWLVLDCSAIPDVDYSAGAALNDLVTFVHNRGGTFALAGLDPSLHETLTRLGVVPQLTAAHLYPTVDDAVEGFRNAK